MFNWGLTNNYDTLGISTKTHARNAVHFLKQHYVTFNLYNIFPKPLGLYIDLQLVE